MKTKKIITLSFLLCFWVSLSSAQSTGFHKAIIPHYGTQVGPSGWTVDIFDTSTNQVITTLTLQDKPGPYVTMSSDGQRAYVGTSVEVAVGSSSRIYVIDLINNSLMGTVNGFMFPGVLGQLNELYDLEISPDGAWLIAATKTDGKIHFIDTTTNTVVNTLNLCTAGQLCLIMTTFSPDSQKLFASVNVNDTIYEIDLPTQTIQTSYPGAPSGSSYPLDIKVFNYLLPNGSFYPYLASHKIAYPHRLKVLDYSTTGSSWEIASNSSFTVYYLDYTEITPFGWIAISDISDEASGTSTLTIVDPATNTTIPITIPLETIRNLRWNPQNFQLWGQCIPYGSQGINCHIGETVVVEFGSYPNLAITPIDTDTNFGSPGLSQDGTYYYAFDRINDRMVIVDTLTKAIINTISTGDAPIGIFMQGDYRTRNIP